MQRVVAATALAQCAFSSSIGEGPARAVATHILTDPEVYDEFSKWGYGQSVIIDAMLLANEHLEGFDDVLSRWVNPILDEFLVTAGSAAFNLSHGYNVSAEFVGTSIGDNIGLYPHAYLHRALHYNSSSTLPPAYKGVETDLTVARRVVDEYILTWPVRWTDGTISRDIGKIPGWENTGEHQYIWGDDAYMGITLTARMVAAGLDTPDHKYASFISAEHERFSTLLRDPSDDLFFHGFNAKLGKASCCKWGRANGWTMMSHVEVLEALAVSTWSGARMALAQARTVFQMHARALARVQAASGRWHQLANNASTFEETSCTAMYAISMVTGVRKGWLDAVEFSSIIGKAFEGLAAVVDEDGAVNGICKGFGIAENPEAYNHCRTDYRKSSPGLGSVLKALVLATTWNGTADLFV